MLKARKELMQLATEEKRQEIQQLNIDFARKKQQMDEREVPNSSSLAAKLERKSAITCKQFNNKMNRKIQFHLQNEFNTRKFTKTKYFVKKKQSKRRRKLNYRKYKKKRKEKKQAGIEELVQKITKENVVVNMSNQTIPNGAILYLAKGLGYVQTNKTNKEDLKFDSLEFLRKVGWKAFFKEEDNDDGRTVDPADIHSDLRVSSGKNPPIQNTLYEEIKTKLLGWVSNHKLVTPKSNLTPLELQGKKWITEKVNAKELFVSKADKGGATLVMNYRDVEETVEREVQDAAKFEDLGIDGQKQKIELSKRVAELVKNMHYRKLLNERDKLLICGLNENNNHKHDPEYKAEPPYIYPLFKIHKLNETQIKQKQIPPSRLVHAAKFGPLYRVEKWCSPYLTQISREVCKEEFVLDSGDLRSQVRTLNDSEVAKDKNVHLFTLDVEKLYPSIDPQLALQAIEQALQEDTDTERRIKKALMEFIQFCFEKSYVQFKDKCYKGKKGLPTGGCMSRQIADIFLHWVLFKQRRFQITSIPELIFWKRFIDDCVGLWTGTKRQFLNFVKKLNTEANKFGINFPVTEAQFGKSVNFLDQTLYLDDENNIQYRSYSKPTDAKRFLNPRSFHPPHIFKSVPTSQMIRVMNGNSNDEIRDEEMRRLKENMMKSGYTARGLNEVEASVQQREANNRREDQQDVITFPITYFDGINELKQLVGELKEDLLYLMGDTRIILAMRKGRSIGNHVVQNKSLCIDTSNNGRSQKCNATRCKQCPLVADVKHVEVNNRSVSIPMNVSCKSDNVIYLWTCNLCSEDNAYFGRTTQQCNDRTSGHRGCFDDTHFEKSALSMHAKDKHPSDMDLKNFKISIAKKVSPRNLKREEFRYIEKYRTKCYGMNRYKTAT